MLAQIRSADELHVGDIVRYKGRGFQVNDKDGVHIVSVGAEYDAKVIQITPRIVALRLKADQGTIKRMSIWDSVPYNWSITRHDIETGIEQLFAEEYYG